MDRENRTSPVSWDINGVKAYSEMMKDKYENRKDTENIFPEGITDAEFRKTIIDIFCGVDWYISYPGSQTQVNEEAIETILQGMNIKYNGGKEMRRLQMNKIRKGKTFEFSKTTGGDIYEYVEETNDDFGLIERYRPYEINRQEIIKKLVILENSYNGDLITPATYIAELQSIIYNFVEEKNGIATAVKNAKIFINDIQDGGDYAFACGIVSALKFIVDEETFIELNELLVKQTKWEQTRNDNKEE